jgi:hypothetical protein
VLRQQEFSGYEIPITHIIAPPIAPLIGRKKKKFTFEIYNYRISSGAVFSLRHKIGNWTIPIVNIDGIAIRFLLGIGVYKKANQ